MMPIPLLLKLTTNLDMQGSRLGWAASGVELYR